MPSDRAEARSRSNACGGAGGMVRSRPIPPVIMMAAADTPVSNEICALWFSTGAGAISASRQPPSGTGSTSWAGMGRLIAPRARPRSASRAPISGSSAIGSAARPAVTSACTAG